MYFHPIADYPILQSGHILVKKILQYFYAEEQGICDSPAVFSGRVSVSIPVHFKLFDAVDGVSGYTCAVDGNPGAFPAPSPSTSNFLMLWTGISGIHARWTGIRRVSDSIPVHFQLFDAMDGDSGYTRAVDGNPARFRPHPRPLPAF